MQFLGKFDKIVCLHPLEGWRPISGKSWIRHCEHFIFAAPKKVHSLYYTVLNTGWGKPGFNFEGLVGYGK